MGRDIIKRTWDELTTVDYVSQQPGIRYRFSVPNPPRADNDPSLNNQPWYHGSNFPNVAPSQTVPEKATPRKKR